MGRHGPARPYGDFARLGTISEAPVTSSSVPFGAAWLADSGIGVDLTAVGYVEDELWITGVAGEWGYDTDLEPELQDAVRYATRVLVRRPREASRFSGTVSLEPLHPDLDRGPTWQLTHASLIRRGHAWVGVTQSPVVASDLAARIPDRYGHFDLGRAGLGYDILGAVAVALKVGRFPLVDVRCVVLSGWSITGSFCRVFVQEGFVTRHTTSDGRPAVDAVLIGKSSGGLLGPGYPALSAGAASLPLDHPRRTVRGSVPTFEVLTESEGETHGSVMRDDSDLPGDRYRLVQIAGTTHRELRPGETTPNAVQYAALDGDMPEARINETPSDARFGIFAGALFEHLEQWARRDKTPPRAPRFAYEQDGAARRLRRDHDGLVIGGVRPPWLAVPTSHYRPTSTPAPGAFLPTARFPGAGTADHAASLIGHRIPFTSDELIARYRDAEHFQALTATHCQELVAEGWILPEAAAEYVHRVRYPGVVA